MPKIVQFSPRGKPGRPDEIELTLDQFEAIKLSDWQGFSQTHGALAMRISRPSFGRILRSGRKILADAIVNGKTIKIRFGDVQVGVQRTEFTSETLEKEVAHFKSRTKKMMRDLKKIAVERSSATDKVGEKKPVSAQA